MAAGDIRIVGFDPSFANWGIAHAMFNMQDGKITVDDLILFDKALAKIRRQSKKIEQEREKEDMARRYEGLNHYGSW